MSVISLVDPAKLEKHQRAAAYLRDLADRFERGEVTEAAVVAYSREEVCFESWGHFEDRWRLLGALEYAKSKVHNQ